MGFSLQCSYFFLGVPCSVPAWSEGTVEGRVEGYVFKQILAEEGGRGRGRPHHGGPSESREGSPGSTSIWSANFVTNPSFVGRLFCGFHRFFGKIYYRFWVHLCECRRIKLQVSASYRTLQAIQWPQIIYTIVLSPHCKDTVQKIRKITRN